MSVYLCVLHQEQLGWAADYFLKVITPMHPITVVFKRNWDAPLEPGGPGLTFLPSP